ncbi:hypothetical protein ACSBR2_016956 [Camellia fascicularis]
MGLAFLRSVIRLKGTVGIVRVHHGSCFDNMNRECVELVKYYVSIQNHVDRISTGLAFLRSVIRLEGTIGLVRAHHGSCFDNLNRQCVELVKDEDKKWIVELLLRDTPTQNKVDVIPITGMGGIGKTTLAQLIYDDDGVKIHFDLKAWVCVSDEFDVKKITKAILESFTLQSCDLAELTALQRKLEDMLAGKKFLLVLDDVWNHRDEEWSSLQSPLRAGAHGSKIIVTTRITTVAEKVMTIKYHSLPSLSTDRCFGYCAIVPKDYEFGEEELVLLWMAEGLIEHPEGEEQIEDVGRRYFHELVSRSFFQSSRHNKLLFIMHDLINDLAQAVAGDICFRLENNSEGGKQNKISDKARHSSYVASGFDGIKKFKAFDDAKCLRTFLEFLPNRFNYKTRYLIHDLLPMLKCLCELRLCYSGIDELPDIIGDLKHLRYLDLSHSRIRKLPESVVTLYNLQVLFLKFCGLEKLPLNMGRLVNLRHFDMTGVHIPSLANMSLHIGKLTNLQTLSNFMVGKDCGRSKCCTSLPPLGQLPLLKDLYIKGMSAIKHLGCEFYGQQCGAKPFPSLERLSFEFMPEWEDWSAFETEGVQAFSHLKERMFLPTSLIKLTIRFFPNLERLSYEEFQNLASLQSLEIWDCPRFASFPKEGLPPSLLHLLIRITIPKVAFEDA